MNYKSFSLGDWIGHISGVIEDETTLDGNEMRDLVEFLSTLEQEPCEDAISRQSMLDYLKYLHGEMPEEEFVKALPSVTPARKKEKWIPCSERMPEDGELVLFSTNTDRVYEGRFFVDNTDFQWYAFRDEAFAYNNVVTAWLPLPKPYKAESEDK